jgi:hypothetical protein
MEDTLMARRRFKRATWRFKRATARRRWAAPKAAARGYAVSPAGKHRRMATLLFGFAKKARAIGNGRHAKAMSNFARRALALSKAEYRLWKRGQALRKRSIATNRALRAW